VPAWKDREINFYWNRRYPNRYQNMTVIQGDYKLVGQNFDHNANSDFELFDLSKDQYEQNDLSATIPEKFTELKSNMDDWYVEMITSPNLVNQPGAIINSKFENPAVFSRNDAGGQEGVWYASEGLYGLWEVEFAKDGYYDFVFKFTEPIDASAGGLIKIQIGTVLHSVKVNDPAITEYRLENLFVPKSKGQMIPQLVIGGGRNQKRMLPFLMEVHSKK
jgi:hypothetical protein